MVVTLMSCAIKHKSSDTGNKSEGKEYTVSGKILKHVGYCGGAAPTPEQANGYDKPMSIEKYVVKDSSGNIVTTFSGSEAEYTVDLKPGVYSFFNAEKELSLAEFKKLNGLEPEAFHKKLLSDECFINWMKRPDATVTVTNKDVEQNIVYRSRCFTGTNPCIQYDGPYPP